MGKPRDPIPRRSWTTMALGALLGLGSPAGLFLYRWALGEAAPTSASLAYEWSVLGHIYGYTLTGTVASFSLFGFILGWANGALNQRLVDLERMRRELERLSVTDGLTGAFVRRHLMERLEAELRSARAAGRSLACLFVDVDNLKAVNDRHGHRVGDRALVMVSAAMQRHLRGSDVLGRYGGDEFVALLPDTDMESAVACAERIRREVESESLLTTDEGVFPLSVSVGVFAGSDLPASPVTFLKAADDALRLSKEKGRNRVERGA